MVCIRPPKVIAVALLSLGVAGCDLLLTDPAATPSTVDIQFQIEGGPPGSTAEAFQRVTRVLVRLTIPDSVPRDTIISVTPDEDAVRIGVKLRPSEQIDGLGIMTRLGYDEVWLFQGQTVASIEPGVPAGAEIVLEPIAARVSSDRDPVVIPNVGETVQLESAVLYASGDTIPGLAGTWNTLSPEVMTVTPEGLATAVSVGGGELVVGYDTLPPDTVAAIVSSVDNGTVTPADTSVVEGSTVQYSVTLRDGFGNVLTDRAVTWSIDDATVAAIDPVTGVLTAVARGTVTVIATAEGVDATTGLTVLQPLLSIDDVTVPEGDAGTADAVFTVTLSAASAQEVTVDYATADGTATAGSDYTAVSGTLTFASGGALAQQITVPVLGDLADEGVSEAFTVELGGAVNATIADGSGTGTITDDDGAGLTVTESGGTTVVDESGATDDFTVVLDTQPLSNVVISVTSADPGEVITDADTLTFTPGNWNVAQTVTVIGVSDTPMDDGDQVTTITLSVDDANSDDPFDPLADQTVSVTTVDIDPLMAFTSGATGDNEIWLRTGGGDLTQLTATGAGTSNWDPEWSPDGRQIVFSSFRDDVNDHVWIMNADGTAQAALTKGPVQHVYPSWSPDGSQIVFARDTASLRDIWVMNRDGTNPTELMANEFEDSQPTWSPDGTQIAFFSDRTGTWQIFTMGSDGSGQTNRSNNDAFEFMPAWSPDGKQIAFVSNRHDAKNFSNWQIYVMDTTEFVAIRLTNNPAQDLQPAWTPDGRIVFVSDRDGDQEIYIMNADGTDQIRLTTLDGPDQFPSIKPGG